MLSEGKKDFVTEISRVELIGPLAFLNQLSNVLGGLGSEQGIELNLSAERARISQTLRFPAAEGKPLFMGPAQIINLALGWFVMIPLQGRDVLSVGFSISSREKPLTIFVPPWYGGKAHVLLELTTKGCRLVEVSMEYGALIPVDWALASGIASLTAGIFYMCEQTTQSSGRVVLRAFVKAAADLRVAGFLNFSGMIYIALSKESQNGESISGEATISVSVKIGFVRISYSFTAQREEKRTDPHAIMRTMNATHALSSDKFKTNSPKLNEYEIGLYSALSEPRRAALERIISGYSV